jgi:hypothetical protein
MKRKLILGLALVLSLVLTGCETEEIYHSRVALTNPNGDGFTKTNIPISRLWCSGGVKDGKASAAFSLGNQHWLVLFYPTNKLNEVLETQTESGQVFAWLVRTQFDCEMLWSAKDPSAPSIPNSEALHGKIQIAQYDWRHNNLFHLALDMTGDDGVVLKIESDSYMKSKFDPQQLWLDPYLLVFGNFVKW